MYKKNSEKVELKISESKLFKKENENSEKVFLLYLDEGSLDRIITSLFLRFFEFLVLSIGFILLLMTLNSKKSNFKMY
jgi:hypothetical protein